MPIEPEGYIAIPAVALQKLVASSARFQQVVGAANSESARSHVLLQLTDDEEQDGREDDNKRLNHARPRAIVTTLDDWSRERRGPGEWQPNAGLLLSFEFLVPVEYASEHNDEYTWFASQIGVILQQMETNRDADIDGDYLPFDGFTMVTPPLRCFPPEHIETFWGCELRFVSR